MRKIAIALMFSLTIASPVLAQRAGQINASGSIQQIDATSVTLLAEDGSSQRFALAAKTTVLATRTVTLADIKPNDFVASAAIRKSDGKLHSTEVRIFPESARGQGEGQRPMNDSEQRTMTNATVTGAAIVSGSNVLSVKFGDGTSELVVDPGVPVVRIEPVEFGVLKAGTKVRLQGSEGPNGPVIDRITIR
jgi:hypothetical protein